LGLCATSNVLDKRPKQIGTLDPEKPLDVPVLFRIEAEALRDPRAVGAVERIDESGDDRVQLLRQVVVDVYLQVLATKKQRKFVNLPKNLSLSSL
jgi:hypothetical protein